VLGQGIGRSLLFSPTNLVATMPRKTPTPASAADPKTSAPSNTSDIELLEDVVASTLKEREQKCAAAFLGYGKADILVLKPVWRTWNKRELVASQAHKIYESFRTHGIQRYVPSHRIPIIVPRDWIVVSKLTQKADTSGDDLPVIEWTAKANMEKIPGATGQHRGEALAMYARWLDKQKEKLEKEIGILNGRKGNNEDVTDQDVEEVNEQLRKVKKIRAGVGYWGFVVYDYGAWPIRYVKLRN
jgi:hypothetical protein